MTGDIAAPLPIVPAPLAATVRPGEPFVLDGAHVAPAHGAEVPAARLVERLAALGVDVPLADVADATAGSPGTIALVLDGAVAPAGAYVLEVATDHVAIVAPDAGGLHHGVATLLQLVEPAGAPSSAVARPGPVRPDPVRSDPVRSALVRPALVTDAPRFGWRGLMLDVARHFHPVATVRTLLDVMADLRLGVLHVHLTDDQGWRLDLPSHPELVARSGGTAVDGDPGGAYSAADWAQIQAYAASRGIVVIPEIDLPGHVNAALHALPELNLDGVAPAPYTGIEVGFSGLRPDLPATAPFVRDVLADVAAMTAGPYVHVGGDEALSMPDADYRALVALALDAVRAAGRTPVGWQEVARADLPAGAVVQYWDERADADARAAIAAAAEGGAQVLLSPATRAYLDMKYDASTPIGLEWAGHITLRDAYSWEPLEVLPEVPAEAVVGVEAAVWAETVRTTDDLFTLLLPRLAAFAEVAWSAPDARDWASFAERLRPLTERWTRAGLAWHHSPQLPW